MPSSAGAQPSGPQQPTGPRERIADFGRFSANSGNFEGQGAADTQSRQPQRAQVQERPRSAPFSEPFQGIIDSEDTDSQALALADQDDVYDDSQSDADVLDGDSARAEYAERFKQWEQWESADDLAEPLHSKFVTVTVDGVRSRVPVSEAANGYMMQSDYSEKLRQLYEYRDQIAAKERGINNFMAALDKGESFLDMMVYIGKFEGFAQAAILYGMHLDAEQRMSPEQRQAVAAARAERARAKELEIELQRLKAQIEASQQPQQSKSAQQIERQLSQMIPLAIQRLERQGFKWEPSPWAQDIWEKHWRNMFPALDGRDLSTDFVANVFLAAIQDIRKQTAAGNIQPPKQLAASQLPPVSNMSGAVQPGAAGRRGKRERIGSLGNLVHR